MSIHTKNKGREVFIAMENERKRFYQKDWFLWLCLILFPPLGLILLWAVHKEKKRKTKIILSVVFVIWFIFLRGVAGGDTQEPTNAGQIATQERQTDEQESVDSEFDKINFTVMNVRNDVTGNWRIATIAESIELQNYAIDYYNKYFKSDEEIHAIVNFTYNTTTKITVVGNLLDVTVYEYVDKGEHDAKLLFSGMLLKEYHVNRNSGAIEEIQ